MSASLVPLTDGPPITLDKPIVLVGRHPECDVQIDSRKVSRRHCCIAQVGDTLVVRDLDSTNGIRVNGVRVVEGRLRPGDELTIGNHIYRVSRGDSPASAGGGARLLEGDALMESCDDPVPVAEPAKPPPVAPPLPRRPAAPDPLVLPDDIHLAPGSNPDLDPSLRDSSL